MKIPTPTPNGNLNINQSINKILHPIKNTIEYGTIVDISVPIPESLSYFSANATIKAK